MLNFFKRLFTNPKEEIIEDMKDMERTNSAIKISKFIEFLENTGDMLLSDYFPKKYLQLARESKNYDYIKKKK